MAPANDSVLLDLVDNAGGSGSAAWFLGYNDANGGNNTHAVGNYKGMQIFVAQPITATAPGSGTSPTNPATVETWHTMSLSNSWANVAGFAAAKYRLIASPPNTVEIIGAINAAAASSASFFTLPAAVPSTKQRAGLLNGRQRIRPGRAVPVDRMHHRRGPVRAEHGGARRVGIVLPRLHRTRRLNGRRAGRRRDRLPDRVLHHVR